MRIRTVLAVLAALAITTWAVVRPSVHTTAGNQATSGTVAVSPSQAKVVSVAKAAERGVPAATTGSGPQRYIVVLKDGKELAAVVKRHGVTPRVTYKHALNGFAGELSEEHRKRLEADPDVAYVEKDGIFHTCQQTVPTGVDVSHPIFNGPGDGWQTVPTGVMRIGTLSNSTAAIGAHRNVNVGIAILDSGIDPNHPDLNVVGGWNFITNTSSYNDDFGHGTHCAGIAAAIDNNFGVVGVAPGARLWALKFISSKAIGYNSDAISALDWVLSPSGSDISVVNMSFGEVGPDPGLQTAIQNTVAAGVVCVAAAGNDGQDVYGPDHIYGSNDNETPAAFPEVCCVAALADSDGLPGGLGGVCSNNDPDDTLAHFSNYSLEVTPLKAALGVVSPGGAVDLAAPGVDIYSTYPIAMGMYAYDSGTSMAAPHVTGAVALYVAANGRPHNAAGVAAIRQFLINSAVPQSQWGPADVYNPGLPLVLLNVGQYTLNAQAVPLCAGTVTITPSQATYPYGSVLTINLADPGYTFEGWTALNGTVSNSAAITTSLTVTGNCTLTASLTPIPYTLNTYVSPVGVGTITVSPSQATYIYDDMMTISATPPPGYRFFGWSVGNGTVSNSAAVTTSLTITGDCTLMAIFTPGVYALAASATPSAGGTVAVSPSQATYAYGEVVAISETTTPGYTFADWTVTGGGTLSNDPTAPATWLMITGDNCTLTASFTPIPCTLTVGAVPAAGGTVVVTPSQATYIYGDVVTISETTNSWATFTMWNIAGGTLSNLTGGTQSISGSLTIHGNCTVSARYTLSSFSGTDTATDGDGTITLSSSGPYYYETQVTATAAADPGYAFTCWTANGCTLSSSTAMTTTLTVLGDWTLTANFTAVPALIVSASLDNSWVYQNTAATTQDRQCRVMTITVVQDSWPDDYFTVAVTQSGAGVVVPSLTCPGNGETVTPTSVFTFDGMAGFGTLYLVGSRRQADGVTGTGSCTVTMQVTGNISQAANAATVQVVLTVRPLGDINGDGVVTTADRVQLMMRFNGLPTPNQTDADFDLDGDGAVTANDLAILNAMLNNLPVP